MENIFNISSIEPCFRLYANLILHDIDNVTVTTVLLAVGVPEGSGRARGSVGWSGGTGSAAGQQLCG